jgi:hypothetical protein
VRFRGTWITSVVVGGGLLLGGAAPLRAQLVLDRLALIPARVITAEGTVRLDGMGGFEAAVEDENFELTVHDFSGNPAGFGDDRDSWSIDLRYSHQELVERKSGLTAENDVRLNDGSLLLGFHDPGRIGVGGRLDFSEVSARDVTQTREQYEVVGFSMIISKYMSRWLATGVEFSHTGEKEDVFSGAIYNISHESTTTRGGLGVGVGVTSGVVLGFRGQVIANQVDGESRSSRHNDLFDWERPGNLISLHGTLDRGRLRGAVDYTRQDLEGQESVKISWSERFAFNPTNEEYTDEVRTMSEDRLSKQLRTRWRLDVLPELSFSFASLNADEELSVITNPNALGSLLPGWVETSQRALIGGLSSVLLDQRLLVAVEVKDAEAKVREEIEEVRTETSRSEFLVRLGGEYLLGERVAGRLGVTRSWESFEIDGMKDDDYTTTNLAVGLGILPAGAIWQLDLAYDVNVDSDLETDWSRFSAYLRYLF